MPKCSAGNPKLLPPLFSHAEMRKGHNQLDTQNIRVARALKTINKSMIEEMVLSKRVNFGHTPRWV